MANLSLFKPVFIFLLVGSIVAGMTSFSFLEDLDVAQNYYSGTVAEAMCRVGGRLGGWGDHMKIRLNSAKLC